ncbi:uncharacterized protein LOC127245371 [Andrographis paniculata]|uniref:uncharacterized protein LOC127245371 n=1 Tax=Andrographis paniculata TaxID=175694 RepID=UPI0021E97670|nr:uncharacterized protein LOC127245371 [Andrographis paniculata]
MSASKPTLWGLLSDTYVVIRSHFLHFLVLAAFFIFPSSILSIIYPLFVPQAPSNLSLHQSLLFTTPSELHDEIPPTGDFQFLIPFLFGLVETLFYLCAIASITYSTFGSLNGKPLKLILSLKSVLVSFLPLLATTVVLQLIYVLIVIAFVILALLSYNAISLMGFVMDYDTGYFLAFVMLLSALLVLAILYLQVKWFLATVVVVLESKWGFEPLKRSTYLVKGMKGMVLSTILVLATPSFLLSFGFYRLITSMSAGGISWSYAVLATLFSVIATMLQLFDVAAITVMYAYCKAWHGEDTSMIDEELGMGYAKLSAN